MGASVTELNQQDRFKDFDDAIEEDQKKPVRFRVKGREYVLAADVEAEVVLRLIREGALTDPGKSVELLEAMVGPDNLRQLFEDKVPLRKFMDLARWLAEEYDIVGERGDGNPPKA